MQQEQKVCLVDLEHSGFSREKIYLHSPVAPRHDAFCIVPRGPQCPRKDQTRQLSR